VPRHRILLVDDHEVVRLGLRALLERNPGFEVVAEAATAREAIERTMTFNPDVVVMDIRLPGGSGIEACQEITTRFPATKVIMLTSYARMRCSSLPSGPEPPVTSSSKSEAMTLCMPSRPSAEARRCSIRRSPSASSRRS